MDCLAGTGVPGLEAFLVDDGARMPLDWLTRLDPLRRIRCPFCFEAFAACEMHLRCDDHYCKTDFSRMIDDPILSQALNGPRFGDANGATLAEPLVGRPPARRPPRPGDATSTGWSCPTRSNAPTARSRPTSGSAPAATAQVAGLGRDPRRRSHRHLRPAVGRQDHLRHGPDPRTRAPGRPGPGVHARPAHRRDPRALRARIPRDDLRRGGQFGVGEDPDGESYRRSHFATPSIETNRRILQPLVYRVTSRKGKKGKTAGTLLSFFDTAGEDWEMNIDLLRGEARYLGQARGLLFLVDPLRIREVALDRRLKLTEKEVRVPPADYLNDARKLATFFGRTPVKTPLAICLNKLDRWGKLMEPGTVLNTLATSVPDEAARPLDRRPRQRGSPVGPEQVGRDRLPRLHQHPLSQPPLLRLLRPRRRRHRHRRRPPTLAHPAPRRTTRALASGTAEEDHRSLRGYYSPHHRSKGTNPK